MYRETWTTNGGEYYMVLNETNNRRVTSTLTSIIYEHMTTTKLEIWSLDKDEHQLGVRTLGKWGI